MIEGESGILACSPADFYPKYEPSKRRLTWPNGAIATGYTAEKPRLLRGPQFHWAWADELAAWQYPEAWDMLQFCMRLGVNPRIVATTTPKPVHIIRELVKDAACIVAAGSTYENARNLAKPFLRRITEKYEGTTLGQQELYAMLLDEITGALWSRSLITDNRVLDVPIDLGRVVVGVDPPISSKSEKSDEAGIVVVGETDRSRHLYPLEDLSTVASPDKWGRLAVDAYKHWEADRIVAEANQGGEMVKHVIHTVDGNVPVKLVHATRGKHKRAEPIAAMYEQKRIHHVGSLPHLEDQMCTWVDGCGWSPDRMDALVWACTELIVAPTIIASPGGALKAA